MLAGMKTSEAAAAPEPEDTMTLEQLGDWLAAAAWRFAKTMPEIPHEYTLRKWNNGGEFEAAVRTIRAHGYQRTFRGRTYTYVNVGEHRFWTMGAPVWETTVINRAKLEE